MALCAAQRCLRFIKKVSAIWTKQRERNREKISNMKKYGIGLKGKSPRIFRLTGRDGPPGLQLLIRGAPAWLAGNMPVQFPEKRKGKGRDRPAARGKPCDVSVIQAGYAEKPATEKSGSYGFTAKTAITVQCRGNPPLTEIYFFRGKRT